MPAARTAADGPLAGVRVVDLTSVVMGPLATRMLGDMGADVIRVESDGSDPMRDYDPQRNPNMSAFVVNANRNKRSVELDLKRGQHRRALLDIAATADVFVTNMRRAALDRLGIDEASIRAINPDIIYCVANGFGSNGPMADRAAYDDAMQAATGLASMFEWTTGEPQLAPTVIADKVTGLHIAFAVVAALHGRAVTGTGATIEVPMAETMASFNMVEHLNGAVFDPPVGNMGYQRLTTPNRRPQRTTDGWIVVLPYSTNDWFRVFEFAGRPELKDVDRYGTAKERINHSDELYALLADLIATDTTEAWLDHCAEHSIPAAPVARLEDLPADPHFEAVGLFQAAEHPSEGPIRYVRDPIVFDGEPSLIWRHAPNIGEQTAAVLREVGWSDEDIEGLS